jgi:hypothetical protein
MSAHEFHEWLAFERVFGPLTIQERVDASGAMSAWGAVVAMHGSGKAGKPTDLLPSWDAGETKPDTKQQSAADMIAIMQRRMKRKRS